MNNADAKLRILVEERNNLKAINENLKAINENLQTDLGDLWDEYNPLEHDYNNPQGGNRSEDETLDETFTFGENKNGPKHRRWNSAPTGAPLFPAQQEQAGKE